MKQEEKSFEWTFEDLLSRYEDVQDDEESFIHFYDDVETVEEFDSDDDQDYEENVPEL